VQAQELKERHWATKVLLAGGDKEAIQALNAELSGCVEDMTVRDGPGMAQAHVGC
jgi:hypothetical protein